MHVNGNDARTFFAKFFPPWQNSLLLPPRNQSGLSAQTHHLEFVTLRHSSLQNQPQKTTTATKNPRPEDSRTNQVANDVIHTSGSLSRTSPLKLSLLALSLYSLLLSLPPAFRTYSFCRRRRRWVSRSFPPLSHFPSPPPLFRSLISHFVSLPVYPSFGLCAPARPPALARGAVHLNAPFFSPPPLYPPPFFIAFGGLYSRSISLAVHWPVRARVDVVFRFPLFLSRSLLYSRQHSSALGSCRAFLQCCGGGTVYPSRQYWRLLRACGSRAF